MLFRIEAAVRTGVTKPSCTSLLSQWNVPKGSKTVLEYKPVADLVLSRSKYGSDNNTALKMKDSNEKYKSFVTCDPKREKFLKNPDNVRKYLYRSSKMLSLIAVLLK